MILTTTREHGLYAARFYGGHAYAVKLAREQKGRWLSILIPGAGDALRARVATAAAYYQGRLGRALTASVYSDDLNGRSKL